MTRYKVNGSYYNVPDDRLEAFLKKYPNAVEAPKEEETKETKDNDIIKIDESTAIDSDPVISTPTRASILTQTKPIKDSGLGKETQKNSAKFNPDGLNYEELLKVAEVKYPIKARRPAGILQELKRLKDLDQAEIEEEKMLAIEPDEEEVKKSAADDYFALNQMPKTDVFEKNRDIRFSQVVSKPAMSIEDYLKPLGKWEQYQEYIKTGIIDPDKYTGESKEENEKELTDLYNYSRTKVRNATQQRLIQNIPPSVRKQMNFYGEGEEFKNEEEAVQNLKGIGDIIKSDNKQITDEYSSYISDVTLFNEKIEKVGNAFQAIKNKAPQGNLNLLPIEDINTYNELVKEYKGLQVEEQEKVFGTRYAKILKNQHKAKLLVDNFNKKINNIKNVSLLEKNIALDYSLGARAAQGAEEFIIGGLVNLGANIQQFKLEAIKALSGAPSAILDVLPSLIEGPSQDTAISDEIRKSASYKSASNLTDATSTVISALADVAIDDLKKSTTDYNLRIAQKRFDNLPEPIVIDDIGKNGITFGNWFAEVFANNFTSIATTFIPSTLAYKGAKGVQTALKASRRAIGDLRKGIAAKSLTEKTLLRQNLKKALQRQKQFGILGMRAAQGIFFVGESGQKLAEMDVAEVDAKKALPKLIKKLEGTTDSRLRAEIQQDIDDARMRSSYSFMQKSFTGGMYGTIATAAETFGTLPFVTGARSLANNIGRQTFKAEVYRNPYKFFWNNTKKTIQGLAPVVTRALPVEVFEEVMTEIGHNGMDIIVLEENKNILEGLNKDFFANVALSTLAIMAPQASGNISNILKNEFRVRDDVLDDKAWVQELIELQATMPNLKGKALINARQKRLGLLETLALSDAMTIQKLTKLTPEEILQSTEYNRELRELAIAALEITRSQGITDAGKKELEEITNRMRVITKARDELLNTSKTIARNKGTKAIDRLGPKALNPKMNYYMGLNMFYEDVAMTLSPKNKTFVKIENIEDILDMEELKDFSSEDIATIQLRFLSPKSPFALNIGNKIILNGIAIDNAIAMSPTNAEARYAAAAPLQELFHIYNKGKKLVKNGKVSETTEKAIDEVLQTITDKWKLGKIDDDEYKALQKRLNNYKTDDSKDSEELLAQLNDAVAIGVLSISDFQNMYSLKNFLNNTIDNLFGETSWMLNLQSQDDVWRFIKGFRQDVLKSNRIQTAPEDKDISESAGLTGFGLEIDAFKPQTGQTLEQYKQDPNYFKAYEAIGKDNEALNSFILKTGRQYGIESNLDVQAIKDNLQLRFIQNYDPSKNPSLFGWMTSGKTSPIRGAVLDQIKAVGKTPTTGARSFDIAQGEVGAAPVLAAEEITVTETIKTPKSKIKQEAPQLIDQSIEDDIETAVLEIAEGVFPDVNSKEFLPFIKEVIDGKLTNKFKTKFGTREQYDNFINKLAPALKRVMPASFFVKLESTLKPEQRQFTEPPIRLTTQADIDKARDNEQINYLENDAQGVNLYKLKKFTPKELATFINPPAINPKTGKKSGLKGTRKTSVATSVATQSAFDMIPSIFKGKVSEFELAKISEKIQRDPRIKFSPGLELSIQELFKLSNNVPGFNLELYGINKLNTLLKNKKLDKTLDLKKLVLTEDGRDEILKQQKWIMANLGPKQMWFGKNGTGAPVFTTSNADYGIESMTEKKLDYWYPNEKGLDIQAIKKSLKPGQTLEQSKEEIKVFVKNPKYNKAKANAFTKLKDALIAIRDDKSYTDYGPEIDGVTDYKLSSYSTLLGNPKNAAAKEKKGDIDKFNTKVRLIHEAMWTRIYDLIGKDKKNAPIIGSYLKLVANHKGHWHKIGAEIVGWSLNPKGLRGTLYEYEHAMPATAAYLYLMDVALNQTDFKPAYNAVMDNYKLIALDKAQNAKLGLAGYGRSMPEGWTLGDNYWWQRYFNEKIATLEGGIDPASIMFTNGRTFEDQLQINSAGQLSKPVLNKAKQNAKNKINLPILKPTGIKFAKSDTNQDVIDEMIQLNKAFENARNSRSSKGISVWDFDDTLAITKSNVLYTLPDGTTGKLSATEFAKRSGELESQGAVFDFSEFNKITKGKKGPMFQKAVNRNNKFGNKNVFILTARPNNAAKPIHDFLKALGLDIPLKNIVGLENGLPSAKVKWIVDKAAEGYNDFYFADDAYKNVKAVQNALSVLDVKSKSRQAKDARIKYSEGLNLNKEFNKILEQSTGIGKEKQYGRTKARAVGMEKGKWDWAGIPPSAQDFIGLTRYFVGKGKQGDAAIKWVKENFADPFARANIDISNARVALANDYKALKKLLDVNNSLLNKKIPGEPYTVSNAIRVYIWGLHGMKVPGLSKADAKILNDYVLDNENLQLFATNLIDINKDNGYAKPSEGWLAGTITTDLLSGLNTIVRAKYLQQWQNNVDEVFTETNMNKLEAAYGKGYRDALENILGRMKAGSNRGFKGDTLTGRFIDWINGSVGAIMFFNMRSAVLQTISAVNFINWSDNNPIQAAKAFANQLQFWKDVVNLMNSDYLIERRNGLKINVNEADIAEIAAQSKNKAKAFIHKLLKLGFLPTQIADSFAIATGGATFYRNRYNSYIKDGMSKKDAETQAFLDFREISEENQQSSRPDRISKQQAGPLGRIILAFANTPAQYARLMQKAASDLKNRRGDDKTNISKILYYGMIQNVIFNALQQALFAMAFNDEEPDEEKKNAKYIGILNGMADSLLRGVGFHGAAIASVKNAIIKIAKGGKAQDAAEELLKFSPPVSSKYKKIRGAGKIWDWDKKEIKKKGWSLDNPAWLAMGQVTSASTNVPLDRVIRKLNNLKDASDANNEEWQRVANALGWEKWELEWTKPKKNTSRRRTIKKAKSRSKRK